MSKTNNKFKASSEVKLTSWLLVFKVAYYLSMDCTIDKDAEESYNEIKAIIKVYKKKERDDNKTNELNRKVQEG